MNLYQIEQAMLDCVDEETGDVIDMEKLEALELERDVKISNLACWIKDLKAEAAAIKEEKDNLGKRQKVAENKAASLSNYLQGYLNGAKFKDARCAISYRKSTTTDIDEDIDLDKLPNELKKITIEPSKSAIKEYLMDGYELEGCRLVEKNNMIIK